MRAPHSAASPLDEKNTNCLDQKQEQNIESENANITLSRNVCSYVDWAARHKIP
jgi:hypothetical protein